VINYIIDSTVFIPPNIQNNENLKNELFEFSEIVNKCYKLIHYEGISVYIYIANKNHFNDEYKKNAIKSGFPVDALKTKINNIFLRNLPNLNYGFRIENEKYYFEDWFGIEIHKYDKTSIKPKLEKQQEEIYENIKIINVIGIINDFILNGSNYNYLVIKDKINYFNIETQNITFSINKIYRKPNYQKDLIKTKVLLKSINDYSHIKEYNFKSILDVYIHAKELFNEYLVFGKDVENSVNEIKNMQESSIRIFVYLESLVEYCKIKRNKKNNLPDDYILKTLGCICSYEGKRVMNDEKAKNERMFDNGRNKNILFDLHLKPYTFSQYEYEKDKKQTVRIYIYWDENQKKLLLVG